MKLNRLVYVFFCIIFMSSFCCFPVYAEETSSDSEVPPDLQDYDYTPAAPPDPTDYPATCEGFLGGYVRDLAFYLATATYDECVNAISISLPNSYDAVCDYFSQGGEDIRNPAEVFRRMLFPNSSFSPYYDPYYQKEWISQGHKGWNGRETYSFGDGILTVTYDCNLIGDIELASHSSLSSINNSSRTLYHVVTGPVITSTYNYPGGGSAYWRDCHYASDNNFYKGSRYYTCSVSNPRIYFSENMGFLLAQPCVDTTIVLHDTDAGTSQTITETYVAYGNPVAVAPLSNPVEVNDVQTKLKKVPKLLKEPDTPDEIITTPKCILLPDPNNDVVDYPKDNYYYYYDPDGNLYLTVDPVLVDPDVNVNPDISIDPDKPSSNPPTYPLPTPAPTVSFPI